MPAPRNDSSFVVSTLRAASCSRCATTSGSDSAGGTARSPRKWTPSGMSRNSSSIDSTPIVSSIASRSARVSERKWDTGSGLREQLLVGAGVEERVDLRRVREPDADEPALAVGVVVDRLGRVDDLLVDLEHLAGERRDHVRDGLDRLDLAVGRVPGDLLALLRRLEVDELAERVLREPR